MCDNAAHCVVGYEDWAKCLESVGHYLQLIEDDARALVFNEMLPCSNFSALASCDFCTMGGGRFAGDGW